MLFVADVSKFYQQQNPSFSFCCYQGTILAAKDTSSNTHQQEKTPLNKM